jgi:hypothetical protein
VPALSGDDGSSPLMGFDNGLKEDGYVSQGF